MPTKSALNVVIVNYRTPDLTIRCVQSIIDQGVAKPEDIVVVDNRSPDNSEQRLTKELPGGVRFFQSGKNAGFGAGVNFGVRQTHSDYLLVLNPDTYFEFDSVSGVIDYLRTTPQVGLVGLDLINPDGSRQHSARRFYSFLDIAARRLPVIKTLFSSRNNRHLMLEKWKLDAPFDAEWVMGTGFIIRSDLYNRIGGMDESYFLYMEDVDLCARVWCEGLKVQCIPGAKLVHDHQRSSAASPFSFAGRAHIKSLLLFRQNFTLPLFRSPGVDKVVKSFGKGPAALHSGQSASESRS
ncbi:glycosyl transferase family 2 [Rhizobium rhizosphaerae]|uniref:Glycosyl transferase family 2 n=2 Tax=Xaviernesmea rhizosphaerae TaxID=1672749 RepID=A0A1Q9AD01_9HYPH|nr:glycosyltransferase family 2 protein [Xaviernesmea rhizosphaerae]OLP52757.1 glycosyl transferase family 2 [Xaviernesmea rhizosphaerae]